jgi:hypothetical protein
MDGEDSPSAAAGRGPGLVGYMEILLMPAWFALRFAAIAAAFVFCCVLLLPRLSYKRIGAFAALFFAGILLLFQDSNWFSAECIHLCRSLFFFFFFWWSFLVKIALLRLSSRSLLRLKGERICLARVSALNAIRRYTWERRQRSSFFFFFLIFRSAALPLLMLLGVFRSA